MKYLNLMIKPASSQCNLKCDYCFYQDIANSRKNSKNEFMNIITLEQLVKKTFEEVEIQVNFIFQGGEPTLVGIDYFYQFHNFVNKYNTNNIVVTFSIQTNGTLIDENWIKFFKKYNYLVGISLDGNKETHNFFRKYKNNEESFSIIFNNLKLLKNEKINFNILTVVNKNNFNLGKEIYNFFRKNNFNYLQFIPCLDTTSNNYSLTDTEYAVFLNDIFPLWADDILKGDSISIRYFDNLINILLYGTVEACEMTGHCNINFVIEADGSIYPCDFYSSDEYKLGDIHLSTFSEILENTKLKNFIFSSLELNILCKKCEYLQLCRGGCKKYRSQNIEKNNLHKFCKSYRIFFSTNLKLLIKIGRYFSEKIN